MPEAKGLVFPRVLIDIKANQKLHIWAGLATGEVSGFGTIEELKTKTGQIWAIKVKDVFLAEQECTSASTEIEAEDLARLVNKLEEQGLKPEDLRLWFHSHGNMGVFWSATDDKNCDALSRECNLLSIVVNKAGEMLARYDISEPFRMTMDKLVMTLDTDFGDEFQKMCEEEFKGKIKPKSYLLSPTPYSYEYGDWHGGRGTYGPPPKEEPKKVPPVEKKSSLSKEELAEVPTTGDIDDIMERLGSSELNWEEGLAMLSEYGIKLVAAVRKLEMVYFDKHPFSTLEYLVDRGLDNLSAIDPYSVITGFGDDVEAQAEPAAAKPEDTQ